MNETNKLPINKSEIVSNMMKGTKKTQTRQELAILIQMDYIALRTNPLQVALYNSELDNFEVTRIKDIVEPYIFPSISNTQDNKVINSYLQFIRYDYVHYHNNNYTMENYKQSGRYLEVRELIKKCKKRQESLRGAYEWKE
jgi:hypothetical protein